MRFWDSALDGWSRHGFGLAIDGFGGKEVGQGLANPNGSAHEGRVLKTTAVTLVIRSLEPIEAAARGA